VSISTVIRRTLVLTAGLGLAAVAAGVAAAPAYANVAGTVDVAAGNTLTIRSGPGTSYGQVGSLADGAAISIECYVSGQSINGVTQWDRLSTGYVSHYYVRTSSAVPVCPTTPPPTSSVATNAANFAKAQVGSIYVGCAGGSYRFGLMTDTTRYFDGTTCGQSRVYKLPAGKKGYDCSGLVAKAYQQAGVSFPWTSSTSIKDNLPRVTKSTSTLQVGDLLAKYGHVVMYIGSSQVVEATPYAQQADGSWLGVRIRSVSSFLTDTAYTAHRVPGV